MCKFIANFFILGYIFVVIHFSTVRITLDHLAVTSILSDAAVITVHLPLHRYQANAWQPAYGRQACQRGYFAEFLPVSMLE